MNIYRITLLKTQYTLTVRPSERKANPRCTRSMGQQLRMAAMRTHAGLRAWTERQLND